MCIDFYKSWIYPPWICYYVEEGELIGSAAFKGRPINNTVEISYGTIKSSTKGMVQGSANN
jgi:hypothetical protein